MQQQTNVAELTYCSSDVAVSFSELLSDALSECGYSVFCGTVEVLIGTWNNSVPSHTAQTQRGDQMIICMEWLQPAAFLTN